MALHSYDLDYQRLCDEEDMNPIRTQKQAVQALIENLFAGKFDELEICHAMQRLASAHGIEENFDLDVEELAIESTKSFQIQRQTFLERTIDLKKAVGRHVRMLKYEIYGDEDVDHQTVNSAISNLEWISDEEILDKKVTIRRV